jgi:hypothetical protein
VIIDDLVPGKRVAVPVSFKREAPPDITENDVRMFTLNKPRVALTGKLVGFRPGPQIGESVPGRSEINFIQFSAWEKAQR